MNYLKRLSMFLVLLLSVIAVYAGGISNAKELVAFAKAVNKGEDISAWRNEKGHIALEGDIDMAKVKIDKIRLSPSMSDAEKIAELERNLCLLENTLEHILTNLSAENMSGKQV